MKFKKLTLKNIRSYESQELLFPEGSLLLSGDVGAGKTTLLLAIEYALFGLQPGQSGSLLLRNSQNLGEVTLELEVADKEIIIERKLKRSSRGVANEYAALTVDGVKIELSITELKTKILEILNYPPEFIKKNNLLYRYTVYTPQEQMKQIILEDPQIRLSVLRHIFGIEKYKTIRQNTEILIAHLKDRIKEFSIELRPLEEHRKNLLERQNLVKMLEAKIETEQNVLQVLLQSRKTFEEDMHAREQRLKEKEKIETELEKAKVMHVSKKDNIVSITKELAELSLSLQEASPFDEQKLGLIQEQLITLKSDLESLDSQHLALASKVAQLEEQHKESIASRQRIETLDICPTCLQEVPPLHKHTVAIEKDSVSKHIATNLAILQQEKEKVITQISKKKDEIAQAELFKTRLEILRSRAEYTKKAEQKHAELSRVKQSLENDLALLVSHSAALKEDLLKFSTFVRQYQLRQTELKSIFVQEKRQEISIASLKKELELTLREIANLTQAISHKEGIKKQLTQISELNDWLSTQFVGFVDSTERHVMLKLRLEFSRVFSTWFYTIAGDAFSVQLDENFTPIVMQGDVEMEYSFLSGGERTALALAYRLALNQTINSLLSSIQTKDVIILDEPTDGFSDVQLDKIRDIFFELKVDQLIIVSHEQKIEGFVDHIIKLKKEGDVSQFDIPAAESL